MKRVLLALAFFLGFATAHAQTVKPVPTDVNSVRDLGNGPFKLRVLQGNAQIFTAQGSGNGSTSGASTTLTLTGTPATPPCVGCVISGNGIVSGTTIAAYNGTTGITLSAPMTVASNTALAWGAACPSSVGSAKYIQAQASSGYYLMYTQARVCALAPGGPFNNLLTLPIELPSSGGGGGGSVSQVALASGSGTITVTGTSPCTTTCSFNIDLPNQLSGATVGDASHTSTITFDNQGRAVSIAQQLVSIPFTQVTGALACAQLPALTGDATNSNCAMTVVKVNGVAFPASPGTDTVPVVTAANTVAWTTVPDCTSGVLRYAQATHLFSCGTAAGSGNVTGPVSSGDFDVALFSGTGGTLLQDAAQGFGLMPGGLKVTNTTDSSSFSVLTGALQVSGGASFAKGVISLVTAEPAFQVANCNVNAMTQLSPFSTIENLMFYDCTDTLSIGPNNEHGRTTIQYNNPRQLFKYDEKISFCQASLDARITGVALGAGGTQSFSPPCRMNFAPNTSSVSNGQVYLFNNISFNMPARTNIYFILNANDNRDMDIRFGASEQVGADIGGSGCYFKMQVGAPTANMRYVCTDGSTTLDSDTGVNNIQNRRIYMLEIIKGTPAGGNPKVNFWCADSNNVLQACGSYNVGTTGLPNNSVNLVPFFRVKLNNATLSWTFTINEVYFMSEQ